jgi:mannose-1-phosphate guanylyltransferase/mannose-6-phosphate isomerase
MSKTVASARVLILAGGSGTRLWPRSTDSHPKPFLSLAGPHSLLRDTFERAVSVVGPGRVLISGRRAHADLLRRELPELPESVLIMEPVRRNTAPAIGLAARLVADEDEDAVLVVLPSDQAVRDERAFRSALDAAIDLARAGDLFVTIGIPPTRPETGFGYMEIAPAGPEGHAGARRVVTFVEKPDLETAARYLASGRFLWNAGIFVFRAVYLLEQMRAFCPDVLSAVEAAAARRRANDVAGFDESFAFSPAVSLDYAVMERTPEVWTVPCDCGWSDLGSWEAVFEFRGGDVSKSVLSGPVHAVEARSNLVLAHDKPIRVIGLEGIVVVDSPEGLLVMKRGASDALRKSVEETLRAEEAIRA